MNPIELLIVGAAWGVWNSPRRYVSPDVLIAAMALIREGMTS